MKISCSREYKRLVLHNFTWEMKENAAFSSLPSDWRENFEEKSHWTGVWLEV